jgi:hypothetical protein
MTHTPSRAALAFALLLLPVAAAAQGTGFKVLATNRTSTMEKEMNDAGRSGYRFGAVMGGETAVGGKEVVVVMKPVEAGTAASGFQYRLLATSKTSTMKRELQDASDAGYVYVGQTVFESLFGGREVVCILEREQGKRGDSGWEYELLATNRTSTVEKELRDAGGDGFELVGMTVAQTAIGGNELVVIMRRKR